jgi:ubiquinone/menaquinone biosynthesis C-methylase UbiE
MGFHTYPVERATELEDPARFRFCSREELVGALSPDPDAVVADVGSGSGFYTDEVAPFVGDCYGVDVQQGMGARYRERGLPDGVHPVTGAAHALPFPADHLDGVVSTMTFHEFADPAALSELRRVLAPDGRVVVVDWTAAGSGDDGPPVEERFDRAEAVERFTAADMDVVESRERPETFLVVATPA